jgi:hypothetical protein
MFNITILSSFHMERGKCNTVELYRIIEKIQPEIIFEELPSDVFEIIYNMGRSPESLEAITIKRYLRNYQIDHVPVDTLHVNEAELFNEFDLIANKSNEYAELMKQQLSMIIRNGYSFLNSDDCDELNDRIRIIEENVLFEINNPLLYNRYLTDRELHNKREDLMLQNIYNYSKKFHYNKALFICGSEHRKSLIQKIQGYEMTERIKLNWILYNGLQMS